MKKGTPFSSKREAASLENSLFFTLSTSSLVGGSFTLFLVNNF
jgi:hypothetical protein